MKKIFLLSSLFLLTMVGCAEQVSSTTSSNNSTTFNNTTSVETTTSETTTSIDQALINAKNEAKKALQDFVEEQIIQDKTQLNNLLTSLLLKIDEASSIEQVNTEKENGLTLLQELANTLKEMEELKAKQLEAISTLNNIDLSNYDEEGKTEANNLINQGVENNYAASTEDEINNIINTVKNGKRFEGKDFTNGNLRREI